MVSLKSKVVTVDNSSVLSLRCIGINRYTLGTVGSCFLGVVCLFRVGSVWKLGQKVALLLVRTCKQICCVSGIQLSFNENGVILIQGITLNVVAPLVTRLKGPLPYKLRLFGITKLFILGASSLLVLFKYLF
jgi:ribosomal protein L14